ncbi:threonine synthase [Xaviernesmea oryzae]|uniref:Threonine synthase n=2 Tax=Xaviernesmea oryzae TaxID=464029 RepID=A0A1X7FVD9_9HYPH|nr:threonine synthase [Xaviernesmea oryzae]
MAGDRTTPGSSKPNPFLSGMRCIKCRRLWPTSDYFLGCPNCARAGAPASVAPDFDRLPSLSGPADLSGWLAYPGAPILGEGNTPLIDLPPLAEKTNVKRLRIKNEGSNPTGSHKDRMSAALVRRARDVGASKLAVASSGNAGVSLAAFASNAGLECVLVTTADIGQGWRRAIELHGAEIVMAPSSMARWDIVSARAMRGEWYPATNFAMPAVGGNPFAVDGLRTIALELHLDVNEDPPTDIIVPVSRADLLWGLAKGYDDLASQGLIKKPPRIHAAEPFPRISRVLAGESYFGHFDGRSPLSSLGGTTVTYQAIDALSRSTGRVITPSTDDTLRAQSELARVGLFVEKSSAITLSALHILRRQSIIDENASVILIVTSHGYKDQP